MTREPEPLQIHVHGISVRCETPEDRRLLADANTIIEKPSLVQKYSADRLRDIKNVCQKYSLGRAQRLIHLAIEDRSPD